MAIGRRQKAILIRLLFHPEANGALFFAVKASILTRYGRFEILVEKF